MTHSTVSVPESDIRLMNTIGAVIQQHTMTSPMTVESLVSVMAICIGSAIANGKSPHSRSALRQIVMANIDHAMQQADSSRSSSIIMPPGLG